MKFEWDGPKASQNAKKHGVTFDEAMTVFGDLESLTVPDPSHSEGEDRFLILGRSSRNRVLVSRTPNEGRIPASSTRAEQMHASEDNMASKARTAGGIEEHYDFTGGVRGKYAARYAQGANVIVLAPDVAEIFTDSIAVNEALRTLVRMSGKTVRAKSTAKKRAG